MHVRSRRRTGDGVWDPADEALRIRFNYWVGAELHEGEFLSEKAVPQGTLFPVRYDPEAPHEHELAGALPTGRSLVLAVGIVGSVVLSLIWFAVMRGCR